MTPSTQRSADKTRDDDRRVNRAVNSAGRGLGSLTRSALEGVRGAERLVRAGPAALSRLAGAMRRHTKIERSSREGESPPAADIHAMVIEEVRRLQAANDQTNVAALETSVRRMAALIESMQQRIRELSGRGPISEGAVREAVGSLEPAEPLTRDERALLVNVFRQNMALQKPDVADAGAGPTRRSNVSLTIDIPIKERNHG